MPHLNATLCKYTLKCLVEYCGNTTYKVHWNFLVIGKATHMYLNKTAEAFVNNLLNVGMRNVLPGKPAVAGQVHIGVWLVVNAGDHIVFAHAVRFFEVFGQIFWHAFVEVVSNQPFPYVAGASFVPQNVGK